MGVYQPIQPISLAFPQPVTALSFDPVSDILWAGTNSGHVISYCSPQGLRGVSYRAGDLAVQKLCSGESYVRALCASANGLGSWAKGGMNKWFYNSSSPLSAFGTPTNASHSLAAANSSPELLVLNGINGTIVRQTPVPSVITHLEFSHSLLLAGSSDGFIRTYDIRTGTTRGGAAEASVRAHSSGIQGLQTSSNFIFTIGLSLRQGRPFPDPLVKIYDLRTMRALPPVPFATSPAFINIVPRRSSSVAITSNQGFINIVDVSNPNIPPEFYQLDLSSYVTSTSISPTGAYFACGDADGVIHIHSQIDDSDPTAQVPFNGFDGKPIEWADTPEPLPDVHWTDFTPLSTIGLPHYRTPLLSGWSRHLEAGDRNVPPPQKIPAQVLSTMRINDNVAYASLPKELRGHRNMVSVSKKRTGRFRSGQNKNDPEPDTPVFEYNGDNVPKMYRHVEIEYSKFGVEDFDFAFYNQTTYSGLETHILNSYTNSVVQVLHYNQPIRRLAKSHITTSCPREHCLLCELGFVVRMLEDAHGTNCQSSNFCKTVGVMAQASNAIDLVDYGQNSVDADYLQIIQSFHRFLFDNLNSESSSSPLQNPIVINRPMQATGGLIPSPITQLFGIESKNVITCGSCGAIKGKDSVAHIVDLVYPRRAAPDAPPTADLATILQGALLREMVHKATCHTCKHFANMVTRRVVATRDLPPILAVNTGAINEETIKFWLDQRGQTFLKPTVELCGQIGGEADPEVAVYELKAVVVQVVESYDNSHLVSLVKVPEAEADPTTESPWYLFNDFAVRNISEKEALGFPGPWKVPALLHFERVDTKQKLDFSGMPDGMDASILCKDTSISRNRDRALIKHECLQPSELPTPGTLVAIDAEFVSMQQEETEYRSDGTHKVLRPARLSLARVSVLRGNGPKAGMPFIDDHIHTSEIIVDYLTEFSGIKFGDLDPMRSPHTLTPLKVVYKKLRLLVDLGCVFIGHGLSKDFRIINIFVPPEQVIDTVDVYFKRARQRRLSLRFLSWFVLGEHIQTDNHDSIEDARSALNLWNKFQEFESEGVWEKKLEELYREGRQYNFKPPPVGTPTGSRTPVGRATPPVSRSDSTHEPRLAQVAYPNSVSGSPRPPQQW